MGRAGGGSSPDTMEGLSDNDKAMMGLKPEETRVLSDAELIKGGARIKEGRLEVTAKQVEEARQEMKLAQANKYYHEQATVNGIEFDVTWVEGPKGGYNGYEIYFPAVDNISLQTVSLSQRPEIAKFAFDYAFKLAQAGHTAKEVAKQVKEFINKMPDLS